LWLTAFLRFQDGGAGWIVEVYFGFGLFRGSLDSGVEMGSGVEEGVGNEGIVVVIK
jgi:hypothetical protein